MDLVGSELLIPSIARAGAPFDPRALFAGGVQGVWYDYQDAATRFQDSAGTTLAGSGDPNGRINDKSGNGNHATQSVSGSRPAVGLEGGFYYAIGDGVDDYIQSVFTISQPWWRMSVVTQITSLSSSRIFGGGTGVSGLLRQVTTPNNSVDTYSGSSLGATVTPGLGSAHIITEVHAGAGSSLALDSDTPVTGNVGSGVPGGITLLADFDGVPVSRCRIYEVVMAAGEPTEQQITDMLAYFQNKYAGILP